MRFNSTVPDFSHFMLLEAFLSCVLFIFCCSAIKILLDTTWPCVGMQERRLYIKKKPDVSVNKVLSYISNPRGIHSFGCPYAVLSAGTNLNAICNLLYTVHGKVNDYSVFTGNQHVILVLFSANPANYKHPLFVLTWSELLGYICNITLVTRCETAQTNLWNFASFARSFPGL